MNDPQIVVGVGRGAVEVPHRKVALDSSLRLVVAIGLLVAAVAGFDLMLAWYPARLSSVAWQFTTLATSPSAFPTIGLGLLAAAVAVGLVDDGLALRVFTGMASALAGTVLIGLTIWLVVVFGKVSPPMEPEVLAGARKALIRGIGFGISWGGALLWASSRLLRRGPDET